MRHFEPIRSLLHSIALGAIVQFSGSIENIPDGWQLCDGTNGTPDLRTKFVIGAGHLAVDEVGGSAVVHFHIIDADLHKHDLDLGPDMKSGIGFSDDLPPGGTFADTDSKGNLPEYYALAYIMEID